MDIKYMYYVAIYEIKLNTQQKPTKKVLNSIIYE